MYSNSRRRSSCFVGETQSPPAEDLGAFLLALRVEAGSVSLNYR